MRTVRLLVLISMTIGSFAMAEEMAPCPLHREWIEDAGQKLYVVGIRAPTLYMISRDLYGSEKYWDQLAKWNNLAAPYHVNIGQRLIISEPAKMTEAEGNKILVATWAKLKGTTMADRLSGYDLEPDGVCATAEEPQRETAATSATAELEAATSPPLKTAAAAEPPTEAAASQATAPTHGESVEPNKHWEFHAAITSSIFSLTYRNEAQSKDNTIYSKINYGTAFGVTYLTSPNFGYHLGAGIDQLAVEPADGGEIKLQNNYLTWFSLGLHYHMLEALQIHINAEYAQRPVARATTRGSLIDSVYIPEIQIGVHLRLISAEKLPTWIFVEGLYALAIKDRDHDMENDFGYLAGLRFENLGLSPALSMSLAYRHIGLNSETEKSHQEAALLRLGAAF